MKELRERRKGHKHKTVEPETPTEQEPSKEPEVIDEIIPMKKSRKARVKKEKIQEIIKDAVEHYFNQL